MKRTSVVLGALLLAAGWAGGAHAVLLSDLLNGGSITAGDKVFDEWAVISFETSDPTRGVNYANIDVTALTGGMDPGPGLRFTVSNGELSVTGDGVYAYVDLMFGFRASVIDPALLIKDNSLQLTQGIVTNVGDNGFFIKEAIGTALGSNNLAGESVEFSWLDSNDPGLISNLSDSASFAPQSEVWVSKNILVWATGTNETASLGGFEQRFSQTVVPEPGSALLLGTGLLGAALARRKKK